MASRVTRHLCANADYTCLLLQWAYSKACPDEAMRSKMVWNLGMWHCGKMLSEKIWEIQGEQNVMQANVVRLEVAIGLALVLACRLVVVDSGALHSICRRLLLGTSISGCIHKSKVHEETTSGDANRVFVCGAICIRPVQRRLAESGCK